MTPSELRSWREGRKLSRRACAALLRINERTLERLEYERSGESALLPVIGLVTELLDRMDAA